MSSPGFVRSVRKRIDIQFLRAAAIAFVVIYHFWPTILPGGFVGVDAFFVLSGFLITSHLWRDFHAAPRFKALLEFYGRRVKRLFPASATVVGAVLLATVFFLPTREWGAIGANAIASLAIVENWWLLREAGTYFGTADPGPLQHFWSLSVEEQFYACWPIAVLLILIASRSLGSSARRHLVAAVIAVASLMSFVIAVKLIGSGGAYFNTAGRIWEFGVGALLGLYAHLWAGPRLRIVRRCAAWAGGVALSFSALLLSSGSDYPGAKALLPVLATALVLAGPPVERLTGQPVLRPIQRSLLWAGDASYSIYLWHWPLLILLPLILRIEGESTWFPFVALVLTLLLSAFSTRYVERIGQPKRAPRKRRSVGLRLAGAGVIAGILMTGSFGAVATADTIGQRSLDRTRAEVPAPCVGASALDAECGSGAFGLLRPELIAGADRDIPKPWKEGCIGTDEHPDAYCEYGSSGADRVLLLWGDSHAGSWAPAFEEFAVRNDVRVIVAARDACPSTSVAPRTTVTRVIFDSERIACSARNEWVQNELVPLADEVVLSNFSTAYAGANGGVYTEGYAELIARIAEQGKPVTQLQDVPLTGDNRGNRLDVPRCLALYGSEGCENPVDRALDTDQLARSLASLRGAALRYVPVADRFCDTEQCYAAIGGLPVYHDASHLTDSFARSLAPWIEHVFNDPSD